MPGLGDIFGGGDDMSSFNYGSPYDNPDASFFEVPGTTNYGDIQATGVGGPGTSLAYNANGDLVETQGTGGDTSGGITNTGGGGAGSAIADLIKKYGLPALLAGLAASDRQKATGGGYGRAYQSPAPLTRTMSQGKYGPIAKYAADGGIIQGYARGGQTGQLPEPDVGSMASGIASQFDPEQNRRAIEAFAKFFPASAIGMTIKNAIEQIRAGDTEGLAKNTAKSMIPFYKTGEKLSEGDMSGAAASLVPPGIKSLYDLITSSPSQSRQAAEYASAFGDPQGTSATNQSADYASAFGDLEGTASNAENAAANATANTAPSQGFTPSVAQPSGMQTFDQFKAMADAAQAQKEQQANNGEVVSFGVPDQNTEQFVDQYSLAQPEAQGTDFGAMNDPGYDGMGGVSDTDPTRGPSVYGNYNSDVGSNFNNPSGPGEGGFGAGSYDNSNLSESGFGSGTGFGGGCPAPWVNILLADGGTVQAGDVKPGMEVFTQHETTNEWGVYPVTAVSFGEDNRWEVVLEDARKFVGTFNHRVRTDADWVEIRNLQPGDKLVQPEGFGVVKSSKHLDNGPIVKITVADAHTYISEGFLSHNIKDSGSGGGINRDDYILAPYAQGGGIAAMAKGRFLRGPGDGVSDSIPATIDGNQPAALADGEFVIPARVVSELGNGSSEAGARKLHAMMVRIQKDRRGAKNIAANTKVDRHLPA